MTIEESISDVWPRARLLLEKVLNRDEDGIDALLARGSKAWAVYDLHGLVGLEVLLKTLFGRSRVGLAQAIPQDESILFEFVWFRPDTLDDEYAPEDVVSVQMVRLYDRWELADINPAPLDEWMTSNQARDRLAERREAHDGQLPETADVLPLALLAGQMKLPILPTATLDEVERLLLTQMQAEQFGVMTLVAARQLWRDFNRRKSPRITDNTRKLWAAAVTFIMTEHVGIDATQGAVAQSYGAPLSKLFNALKVIRDTLNFEGADERYIPIQDPTTREEKSWRLFFSKLRESNGEENS